MNTYHIFRHSVVVHVNGTTITVSKDDKRYKQIVDLIHENRLEEMGVIADNEAICELEHLLGIS